jgi:amino acid adenylation domain-containing protein/thioester reductase-like protein
MFFNFDNITSINDLKKHIENERLYVKSVERAPFSMIAKKYRQIFPNESADVNIVFSPSFLGKIEKEECLTSKFQDFYKPSIADIILYNDRSDFQLEWNPEKINDELAKTIIDSFINIVHSLSIKNGNTELSNIGLLSDEEERVVAKIGTGTEPAYKLLIHEIIDNRAEKNPDSIAIETNDSCISYLELKILSDRFATFLKDNANLRKGDKVLVFTDKSFDVFGLIIAILKIGCIYVPVDPMYPIYRIQYIMESIDPKVIFIDFEKHPKMQDSIVFDRTMDIAKIASEAKSSCMYKKNDSFLGKDDLAYIIFTSGTTGNPKGVMVTHGSIANFLHAQAKAMQITNDSRMLHFAPLSFDTSFAEWGTAFSAGARICFSQYNDNTEAVFELSNDINRFSITHAIMTPSLISTLNPNNVPTLRVLVSAGEPCSNELINRWIDKLSFFNACGPTETTVGTNICLVDKSYDSTFVGFPLTGVNEYIFDQYKNLLPCGVIGDIAIGGTCVSCGYINDTELTGKKFVSKLIGGMNDRVYCSGDLGMMLSTGFLRIFGRTDNQVKIRGFRVELEEVRLAIQKIQNVVQAVVKTTGDDFFKQIVAYVKLGKDIGQFGKIIYNNLSEHLPWYMIPAHIFIVKDFSLNEHGKVDVIKSSIVEEMTSDSSINDFIDDDIMNYLIELWKDVIGFVPEMNASFFACGGDSISAISLIVDIENHFNVKIKIQDFLKSPSLIYMYNMLCCNNSDKNSMDLSEQDAISLQTHDFDTYKSKNCHKSYILLTGSTGFIGSKVLKNLILEGKNVCCLVRAKSIDEANAKLKARTGMDIEAEIKVLLGDLSQNNLGLSYYDIDFLKDNVECICHSGCHVNHVWDYAALRSANVLGTLNLINLAADNGARFIYISALSAINDLDFHGNIMESFPIDYRKTLVSGGYNETKWVCEHLLKQAQKKGMPMTIFRPCSVIPKDVSDYNSLKNDHLILLLKDIVYTKIAPNNLHPIIPISIDTVSHIIAKALINESSNKDIVNLSPSRILKWSSVLKILMEKISLDVIPYDEWVCNIKNSTQKRAIFPISMLYNVEDSNCMSFGLGKESLMKENYFITENKLNVDSISCFSILLDMICAELPM